MSVSDERLDTLIAETAQTAKTWKDFDSEVSANNPEYESIVQSKCDDLLSALEELRSIRQAATAGAMALNDILEPYTLSPEDAALMESMPVAEFPPRRRDRAATAGVEEAANKLVRFIEAKISEWLPGELTLDDDEAKAVRDFLTALLAERDAVLRECRDDAAYIQDSLGETPVKYRSAAKRITDRIDALTKGGVDET